MSVPSNWREFAGQNEVTFAPEGAYGDQGITHGAIVGMYRGRGGDLMNDTRDLVNGLLQANGYLQARTNLQNARIAGRQGYTVELRGTSPVTRRVENVTIFTVSLRNGDTFWIAAVSPENESFNYNNAFRTMINSIRLNDFS
ncbi:hypothetical protein [Leptolyngbya sp. 7M]|uniref:hypothetical protein n=1 Tax=Leptolyngbya sp. 7M TaxID=2812896 RepID=UPI001B8A9238|nr:hypothetical protein [Leptolyngbya sp. 7M]QYO66050.1 hypothetical protein JVX88_04410 [Leptolyngbya sp. 7M]